jgi:hypothetical protein
VESSASLLLRRLETRSGADHEVSVSARPESASSPAIVRGLLLELCRAAVHENVDSTRELLPSDRQYRCTGEIDRCT